jgi:hydrogenase maturation protein HypF
MRLKLQIAGLVQGVGFRPFIYRLAQELGLKGYILNDTSGVLVEAEGEKHKLDELLIRIDREKPPVSRIFSLQHAYLEDTGFSIFEIRESNKHGDIRAAVLPDIATCEECMDEVLNPKDRRFIYLFTNCTNCGPRFSIINSLPYDRNNTSMAGFQMCPACKNEYGTETDRRFHAQPNACHECGPWIRLHDNKGNIVCEKYEAVVKTVSLIKQGEILAVKGIGGYHLVCDAASEAAVIKLRERKNREEKPIAVMFPNMDAVKEEANINALEERAITSIERPIVIVEKKDTSCLSASVSPDNSTVGVFLPYTPLHHVILRKLRKPVVATSANLTDEPIVSNEKDAFERLSEIADYILTNNRGIVRRCDDSVVRIAAGRQLPVRRSRGYAPLPVILPFKLNKPILALGPYMNNTIALGIDDKAYMSQYIGDLDTPLAIEFYEETVKDFLELFDVDPEVVIADMHPGYHSTKFGERHFNDRLVKVQHHFAHILSCMAENGLPIDAEVIGFAFDGTGYGVDKTIWGGEVLVASRNFRRALHLRPYKLPGGDKCVKEPCRTALSLLYETFGEKAVNLGNFPLSENEKYILIEIMKKDINSPLTSSMGRLFDAVASLTDVRHTISYHAQAAILLEQLALKSSDTGSYEFVIKNNIIYQLPIIDGIVEDLKAGIQKEAIARKFHTTVENIITESAELIRAETGISHVVLSGGVFQNRILIENAFRKLKETGFTPIINQMVPSNDGGISLGQVVYSYFV